MAVALGIAMAVAGCDKEATVTTSLDLKTSDPGSATAHHSDSLASDTTDAATDTLYGHIGDGSLEAADEVTVSGDTIFKNDTIVIGFVMEDPDTTSADLGAYNPHGIPPGECWVEIDIVWHPESGLIRSITITIMYCVPEEEEEWGGGTTADTTMRLELSCPSSATRGESIECTATASHVTGDVTYAWEFKPRGLVPIWDNSNVDMQTLGVVEGRTDGDTWSGTAVWGGEVKVTATDDTTTATAKVSFTVSPRSWSLGPIQFTQGADIVDSIVLGGIFVAGSNRDAGTRSSVPADILRGEGSAKLDSVASGPNRGYWYVTSHGYTVGPRTWHVNSRLQSHGPKDVPRPGGTKISHWDSLANHSQAPHPRHMLAGTTGHEGRGANGAKGHQGQIDKILRGGTGMCGDAAAMVERVVAASEAEAEKVIDGTPSRIGIEKAANSTFAVGTSHYHVHGNHTSQSGYMYWNAADSLYYPHWPHNDPQRPLPDTIRRFPRGPGCNWSF